MALGIFETQNRYFREESPLFTPNTRWVRSHSLCPCSSSVRRFFTLLPTWYSRERWPSPPAYLPGDHSPRFCHLLLRSLPSKLLLNPMQVHPKPESHPLPHLSTLQGQRGEMTMNTPPSRHGMSFARDYQWSNSRISIQ